MAKFLIVEARFYDHLNDMLVSGAKAALKATPKFDTEKDERAYWESHDSTEHLDWSKATKSSLPNLKSTSARTTPKGGSSRQ